MAEKSSLVLENIPIKDNGNPSKLPLVSCFTPSGKMLNLELLADACKGLSSGKTSSASSLFHSEMFPETFWKNSPGKHCLFKEFVHAPSQLQCSAGLGLTDAVELCVFSFLSMPVSSGFSSFLRPRKILPLGGMDTLNYP